MARYRAVARSANVPAPRGARATCSQTSPRACRRWRSPASARCPTCRRRTTGSAATSSSTSGSPPARTGAGSSTWPAGRATARRCSGRTAASVVGVDANPEAFEHARLKYTSETVRFERNMIELWRGDVDCVVFLQTIEHVQDPDAVLERDPRADRARRRRVRLHAERAHARARRAPSAPATRGTCTSTARRSSRRCARGTSASVDLLGLFHARKLRAHQWAIEHAGWDAIHRAAAASRRRSTTASRPPSRCATSRCAAATAGPRAGPPGRAASVEPSDRRSGR